MIRYEDLTENELKSSQCPKKNIEMLSEVLENYCSKTIFKTI